MLLYGAGGHAKAIIGSIIASGGSVKAIFDDHIRNKSLSHIPVQGYDFNLYRSEQIIIAIGDNSIRRIIVPQVRHHFGIAVHPSAIIDRSVVILEGSVVLPGCILQPDTGVGKHVIINTMVSVDHECVISDFVHLAPGVTLCGNVQVGENTLIGSGSVVVPNVSIGKNCLIAAGSVVTQNIPDSSVVRGNPARIIKILDGRENLSFASASKRT